MPGGSGRLHLWPAAPVDVDADGTVGAAAAHEEVGAVVGLHHPHEVPTAVLEKRAEVKGQRPRGGGGWHKLAYVLIGANKQASVFPPLPE